jgi:hypothetical protein
MAYILSYLVLFVDPFMALRYIWNYKCTTVVIIHPPPPPKKKKKWFGGIGAGIMAAWKPCGDTHMSSSLLPSPPFHITTLPFPQTALSYLRSTRPITDPFIPTNHKPAYSDYSQSGQTPKDLYIKKAIKTAETFKPHTFIHSFLHSFLHRTLQAPDCPATMPCGPRPSTAQPEQTTAAPFVGIL